MKSAEEDNKQLARLRVKMCMKVSLETSDGLQASEWGRNGVPDWWSRECETGFIQVHWGSWWNKVVRTTPTRGPREEGANVLGSLPIAYFKHHYITTAWPYFSCFVNGRSLRLFSSSSVGIDRSEKMSFAARRWREFSFFRWTSQQPSHRVEA